MIIFYQTNTIGDSFKNILSLPSFIMAVNGGRDFEAPKKASIRHKINPYSSRGLIKAF